MSITHLAGPAITIDGRVVQRCSICGAKLGDSLNVAAPLNADGTLPGFPTWEVGRLIRVTTGNPISSVMLADSDRLPPDNCTEFI